MRVSERGNVLFYIFVAVALLGALSFAVSNSNRGNIQQLDSERARLYATEIIEYGNIVATAVNQLKLRGCSETEISMENDFIAGYTNPSAPSDLSCHVFRTEGGGVVWRNPEPEWLDPTQSANLEYGNMFINASSCILYVGTNSATLCNDSGDDEELLLLYGWLDKQVCLQINELLSINNSGEDPPKEVNNAVTADKFTGSYGGDREIGHGPTGQELAGRQAGCFEGDTNPNGGYHFYQVLIAR